MDEEQGLASPIAGNLRGIRRSISSSVFAGRPAVQTAKPDPETTSLLTQNSLALSNVSEQLNTINSSILFLSNSLNTIKQNLALSDQLERQREAAKQRRDAILAEQGLREGKESELEKKIQNALFFPVRRIAQKAQGIFARLASFLLILVSGWLTSQTLEFFKLKTENNVEGLRRFKRQFLSNLLFLGATFLIFKLALAKIIASLGLISSLTFKFTIGNILLSPFKAAGLAIIKNIDKFKKNLVDAFQKLLKDAPELLRRGKDAAKKVARELPKNIKRPASDIIFEGLGDAFVKDRSKNISNSFLRQVPLLGIDAGIESLFAFSDFQKEKKQLEESNLDTEENISRAKGGQTGGAIGSVIVTGLGLALTADVFDSLLGLLTLSLLSSEFGEKPGDAIGRKLSDIFNREKSDDEGGEIKVNTDDDLVLGIKKDMSGEKISSLIDPNPEIFAINNNENAGQNFGSVATANKNDAVTLPTITSTDFLNTSLILSESLFNLAQ